MRPVMPSDGAVTRRGQALCVVVALVVIGAGCNSRLIRPPAIVYADAAGHPISATVRDIDHRFNSVLLSFFPSTVALHPGDALNFEVRDSGEPHTVAMGRLVDSALDALAELGATSDVRAIEALPEMKRLPSVFPEELTGSAPRANRSAVERCFLPRGEPPVAPRGGADVCPERDQPEFDGRQSFYSSGFLEEGEPFRVKLSQRIEPGTYGFMCLVHRASMVGAIEVRPTTAERPRVADVRKEGDDEEDEVAASLEPAARRAAARERGAVLAGTGAVGRIRGYLSSFIPENSQIDSGDSITWQLFGMHSISFEPSRDAEQGILVEEGGSVRINDDAWKAVSSPAQPAAAVSYLPSAEPVEVDGGSWSGEGSFSSGILRATPPGVVNYKLTFTSPGTYRYRCLVHTRMRGRVVVGGDEP